LRHYKPPPPQPLGEVFDNAKQVFVYEGTKAYDAWAAHKARQNGIPHWHLTTRKFVEGSGWRTGWYFPSLFPLSQKPDSVGHDPPTGDLTEDDIRAFTE
jgi:hypothetical protein